MVRHWILVPAFGGSNPSSPAMKKVQDPGGLGLFSCLESGGIRTMQAQLVGFVKRLAEIGSKATAIPHPQPSSTYNMTSMHIKDWPVGLSFNPNLCLSHHLNSFGSSIIS